MLKWRDGIVAITTKSEGKAQVHALVSEDGLWAYGKVRGRYTLTHVPSGFAVWHQRAPFAYKPLARDLAQVGKRDAWGFTNPAVLAGTPLAYNVMAVVRQWVMDGKLQGKVVKRG